MPSRVGSQYTGVLASRRYRWAWRVVLDHRTVARDVASVSASSSYSPALREILLRVLALVLVFLPRTHRFFPTHTPWIRNCVWSVCTRLVSCSHSHLGVAVVVAMKRMTIVDDADHE